MAAWQCTCMPAMWECWTQQRSAELQSSKTNHQQLLFSQSVHLNARHVELSSKKSWKCQKIDKRFFGNPLRVLVISSISETINAGMHYILLVSYLLLANVYGRQSCVYFGLSMWYAVEFVKNWQHLLTACYCLSRRLLLLLDRHTLRLLAGNCRLQDFNVAMSRSLEQAVDVALHAVSELHVQIQPEGTHWRSHQPL